MKKKLLALLGLSFLTLSLGACGQKSGGDQSGGDDTPVTPVVTKYTVAFEVDGVRVKTLKIEEGQKITETIADPTKDGYKFVGWYEGETLIDLSTYVVTKNVTFTAKFEEDTAPQLSVDDVKEAGKTYYLVMGWWECTDVNEDGSPKITSHLTRTYVRLFYENMIKYLKTVGATNENIANIQFRNYSSTTVALMGEAVNADADVDILIGVGNNINSTAGVSLDGGNDGKFQTPMGDGTARYVACPAVASDLGKATFSWLKETDAGKAAFIRELTQDEIDASLVPETIDLTVTVHGDTDAVTHLQDKTTAITMPQITVPEDKNFKGFALTADGEVALDVAKDATLKYDDLKDLVAANANTLDLYPVLEAKPVVLDDLVVYVQINGSNLTLPEGKLLEARFNESLTESKKVKFNFVEGDATTFTDGLGDDADVVIGGNNPLKNYTLHDATEYPLANAGAKHFKSTNRKVIIRNTVATAHVDLAVALYNFVKADAPAYEFHAAFWPKSDNSWVSADERAAIVSGMEARLNTYMGVTGTDTDTLADVYNITLTNVDVNVTGNKVADLGAATRALREGKGTDLIIGCGGNVDSETGAGMTIVEKKDIPTAMVAAGRKVALVTENVLAREIYDNYFVEQAA